MDCAKAVNRLINKLAHTEYIELEGKHEQLELLLSLEAHAHDDSLFFAADVFVYRTAHLNCLIISSEKFLSCLRAHK